MSIIKSVGQTVIINGIDISDKVAGVTVQKGKSASATWSVDILDPVAGMGSSLRPVKLERESLPATFSSIIIESSDGVTYTFDHLILQKRSYSADPEQGYRVTLSGGDLSKVLFVDGYTLETYEATNAKAIIIDLLSKGGITSYEFLGDLDDILENSFPVVQFDVQRERLINRIQTILNECGAFWEMNGDTFRAWIPDISGEPELTFSTPDDLYVLSLDEETQNYYDKVEVTRMSRNSDLAGQQEGTGVGRQNITLSGVFYTVRLSMESCFNSYIATDVAEVNWFFEGSEAGSGLNYVGPADEVYYTILATDPGQPNSWNVKATGTPEAYHGSGVDLDTQVIKTIDGSSGNNEAPRLASNLTPNNTVAELKADAFLREQGYIQTTTSFAIPMTAGISLDKRFQVEEQVGYVTGIFNLEAWSVRVEAGKALMTLEGRKFDDSESILPEGER